MTLFPPAAPPFDGPKPKAMPEFEFLARSTFPEAVRVRVALERWFAAYPEEHKGWLAGRLAGDEHQAAFFELVLHEVHRRAGCTLEVEPTLPHISRKPDFLVTPPSGKPFYLEATLADEVPKNERAAANIMSTVETMVDEIRSPDFFLSVHHDGTPEGPIATSALRRHIVRWLADLDYETVVALPRHEMPTLPLTAQGVEFTISVVPKRTARGGLQGRAIKSSGRMLTIEQAYRPVRERLFEKARRYGRPGAPFIVAVNDRSFNLNQDGSGILDVLLGHTVDREVRTAGGVVRTITRTGNGAWLRKDEPQGTRVSAVLYCRRLDPWRVAGSRAWLVRNPWAVHPLDDYPIDFSGWTVTEGTVEAVPGRSPGEVLGLDPAWPG